MQRTVLGTLCVVLALWVVGCNAFSSRDATPAPTKVRSSQSDGSSSQSEPTVVRLPPSPCDARLFGRVTGKAPGSVKVRLVGSKGTFETPTDGNGLYGFAGLCAGEYKATVRAPSGATSAATNVKLEGNQELKLDLSFQ